MAPTSTDNLDDLSYAGFWVRLWAGTIDFVLSTAVILPLLWAVYGDSAANVDLDMRDPLALLAQLKFRGPADYLIQLVLPVAAVMMFWVFRSATPGKMAIGARIVDARTGQHPTTRQLIIRMVGYLLSWLPLCLGFLWIALDRRKQGWHDKLAGTVVVRAREKVRFDERPAG